MRRLFFTLCLVTSLFMNAQEKDESLPYAKIPEYPESFTAGTVVSRMIDGLGFRYYWATEGLREEDLAYKPSETNRTTMETIDHIYGLSRVIYNSAIKKPNDNTNRQEENFGFEEKRARTLRNLKRASEIFLKTRNLAEHKLIFINSKGESEYPFWNQINGPIEDAVWHCGQIVAFRRASGNPFPKGVSVFNGVKRDFSGG